jgi:hypothetical protein
MMVRSDLYIALIDIGIDSAEAARLANPDKPDLESAIVAVARKFREIQRALDNLEDGIAKNMGEVRSQRFGPKEAVNEAVAKDQGIGALDAATSPEDKA